MVDLGQVIGWSKALEVRILVAGVGFGVKGWHDVRPKVGTWKWQLDGILNGSVGIVHSEIPSIEQASCQLRGCAANNMPPERWFSLSLGSQAELVGNSEIFDFKIKETMC